MKSCLPPEWNWTRFFLAWWIPTGAVSVFVHLFHSFRCNGVEHLPREGPLIYAANHQSLLDPPIIAVATRKRPIGFLARESLFDALGFGAMIRYFGAIPVRRGQGATAGVRAAMTELKADRSMLLFPEGTRSEDGRAGPFLAGLQLLVRRSGASVVPVAIEGAHDVWPRKRSLPRLRGVVHVHVGDPISAEEFLGMESDAALDRIRREVETKRLELRAVIREKTRGRFPPAGPADKPYWEETAPDEEPAAVT